MILRIVFSLVHHGSYVELNREWINNTNPKEQTRLSGLYLDLSGVRCVLA